MSVNAAVTALAGDYDLGKPGLAEEPLRQVFETSGRQSQQEVEGF